MAPGQRGGASGAPATAHARRAPARRPGGPHPITGKGLVVAAAAAGGSTLTSFSFDFGTGALMRMGAGTPGGASADYVAFHPGGKFLYVNNEVGSGRATAMSVGADGSIDQPERRSSGGGPCHIWVHKTASGCSARTTPTARWRRCPSATTAGWAPPSPARTPGQRPHGRWTTARAATSCSCRAAAAGHVALFKFNAANGMLTANSPATIAISQRPRHMAFNPNGRSAYVTHESRTALTTFNYDSTTGLLSGPRDTPTPNDGAHVLVHPSGNFVYHIARGGDAVSSFSVGADGGLTMIERLGSGGYDATMSKDGRYLMVVSGTSLRVYAIDGATGKLTAGATGQTLQRSQSVAVTQL